MDHRLENQNGFEDQRTVVLKNPLLSRCNGPSIFESTDHLRAHGPLLPASTRRTIGHRRLFRKSTGLDTNEPGRRPDFKGMGESPARYASHAVAPSSFMTQRPVPGRCGGCSSRIGGAATHGLTSFVDVDAAAAGVMLDLKWAGPGALCAPGDTQAERLRAAIEEVVIHPSAAYASGAVGSEDLPTRAPTAPVSTARGNGSRQTTTCTSQPTSAGPIGPMTAPPEMWPCSTQPRARSRATMPSAGR